jgi:hypothetical protein
MRMRRTWEKRKRRAMESREREEGTRRAARKEERSRGKWTKTHSSIHRKKRGEKGRRIKH